MQKEKEKAGFLYTSASSFSELCQTRDLWTHLTVSMCFKRDSSELDAVPEDFRYLPVL